MSCIISQLPPATKTIFIQLCRKPSSSQSCFHSHHNPTINQPSPPSHRHQSIITTLPSINYHHHHIVTNQSSLPSISHHHHHTTITIPPSSPPHHHHNSTIITTTPPSQFHHHHHHLSQPLISINAEIICHHDNVMYYLSAATCCRDQRYLWNT